MKQKGGSRPALALTLTALLLLSLVPILLVGDCAHPYGDDYAYSQFVHHALADGDSFLGTLAYTVRRYYFGWQGTYAATVFMALQPGLISEQAYLLVPILLLGALCLSTAAFTHALLCRWLKQDRWTWLSVTAGLLLCTVQFQPNLREAFFWWNGGVYYTWFYGMMLLLFTCLLRLRLEPKHPAALYAASLGLAVAVGGGNYVTGLLSCLVLGGYALACLIWDRRRAWQGTTVGVVLVVCFLINTLAPGNAVRQAQSARMPAFQAIWESITQAGLDAHVYIHLPFLALMAGLVPVFWRAFGNTKFRFPLPGLATAAAFLALACLACQNVPHFYALGTAGPGRLRNIVYDGYLILLLLAEGYWVGWLRRKTGGEFLSAAAGKGLVKTALFVAAAGFLLSYPMTQSYQCAQILADGSARTYDEHINGWVEALSDPDIDPVKVTQLPVFPAQLYGYNLSDNPDGFANGVAALYYGKTSVVALPAEV